MFVSALTSSRHEAARPSPEGDDRAERWSVRHTSMSVTADAMTTQEVLDAAQTDRVPAGQLMLGRTGQELGNDGLDIRFAEPAVK